MSSFLRSAATTAAGVAAGALAFEGIRSLFGGMEHMGGFGGGGMQGGSFLGGTPETIVNNYYDSPDRGDRDDVGSEDRGGRDEDLQASGDDSTQSADSADSASNSGTNAGSDSGSNSGSDSGGSSGSDSV